MRAAVMVAAHQAAPVGVCVAEGQVLALHAQLLLPAAPI